jgi:ABC-type antimicrobial peptide transport system permease subunit
MSANLLEQRKEIAVLRAIGMTKCRIRLLYFYEALILVFASSILGIMIGLVVGYTMALQMALLIQKQLPFEFPLEQFILVFILSIICSMMATFGPSSLLLKSQIASIFRS